MRLVIKVGTSLIAPQGRIDTVRMRALVDQLDLSRHEYLIVSSGAIASGMSNLSLAERPSSVPRMQACAAVGQSLLMHTYFCRAMTLRHRFATRTCKTHCTSCWIWALCRS